jgi:hypothetical protein
MTKVWVRVDRAAALRSGINGTESPVEVELDVAAMTDEQRAEVGARFALYQSHDRELPYNAPYLCDRSDSNGLVVTRRMTVVEPSQAGVLAEFQAYHHRIANAKAAEAAKEAERLQQGLNYLHGEPIRQTCYQYVHLLKDGSIRVSGSSGYFDQIAQVRVEYEREYIHTHYGDEATQAACKAREAQLKAETESRWIAAYTAAKDSLIAEHITPRIDWVNTHGSADLRRMVAEGMVWLPLCEEDRARWQAGIDSGRLLAERPGWIVVDAKQINPPLRPRSRAWAILDAARLVEPAAKLGRLNGKYVAYAEFNGKTIVWPAD